jgi:hypothetical protein
MGAQKNTQDSEVNRMFNIKVERLEGYLQKW